MRRERVRVFCRLRPRNPFDDVLESKSVEQGTGAGVQAPQSCVSGEPQSGVVRIDRAERERAEYQLDAFFPPGTKQEDVYAAAAKDVIEVRARVHAFRLLRAVTDPPTPQSVTQGYNGTVFAYGQTGTGKTYTMYGSDSEPGVVPRALDHLFGALAREGAGGWQCSVSVMLIQIYCELLTDLLAPYAEELRIRESPERGVFVEGATCLPVASTRDAMDVVRRGLAQRATAATRMNELSSRSHVALIVNVEKRRAREDPTGAADPGDQQLAQAHAQAQAQQQRVVRGQLFLVDLAGSERVDKVRRHAVARVPGHGLRAPAGRSWAIAVVHLAGRSQAAASRIPPVACDPSATRPPRPSTPGLLPLPHCRSLPRCLALAPRPACAAHSWRSCARSTSRSPRSATASRR